MLDINLIVNNPTYVHDALLKKGFDVDFAPLISLYEQRKKLIAQGDELKNQKNKLAASVPVVKKEGGDVEAISDKSKSLTQKFKSSMQSLQKWRRTSSLSCHHFQICLMTICLLEKRKTIK